MKKTKILFTAIIVCAFMLPAGYVFAQDVTTIYLVRHGEKVDDSRDPELSNAGKARSWRLSLLFEKAGFASVYSTDYIRTRETCRPTAETAGVELKIYDPREMVQLDAMVAENRGKSILICGHSNTVPRTANHFLGKTVFQDFDESDYNNLLIVTIPTAGEPGYSWLRF